MIAGLKPYPRYKDSGVEWLGEVPEGWEVRRLINIFDRIVGGATPASSVPGYWGGNVVWATPSDVVSSPALTDSERHLSEEGLASCSASVVPAGSIVLTTRAPVGNVAVARVPLATNQGCKALVSDPADLDPRYAVRLVTAMSPEFKSRSVGTTFYELPYATLRTIAAPVPPLTTQATIAAFLDHAIGRIERCVAGKLRLIELLEDEKRAVIHRAVTRGLDPNVRLKPSGVDWLGDVPEHWEVVRLRTTIDSVIGGVWGHDPTGVDDLTCVRVADFDRESWTARSTASTKRSVTPGERARRLLERGDLLLEKSGGSERQPVGVVVRFDQDVPAICSNFVARLSVRDGFDSEFLTYLHAALYSMGINVRSIKQTTGIQNLSVSSYLAEKVCVPDSAEQRLISTHLGATLAHLQTAQHNARHQITLLDELRTCLISDVVTGKLDVQEAAARLPADPEDLDPALEQAVEEAVA